MRQKVLTEKAINRFIKKLERITNDNEEQIISILNEVTNASSARVEIASSLGALKGAKDEILENKPQVIDSLFIYYPSNMIFYSYVLYVLIPYIYTRKIYIRPSGRVRNTIYKIHNIFKDALDLDVFYQEMHQKEALEVSTECDVTIFTGQFENAEYLKEHHENVFIYYGSGINPFIIGEDSNISSVVASLMDSRLFNAGQDCLCSDIYFVPKSKSEEIVQQLKQELDKVTVSKDRRSEAEITPIIYNDVLTEAKNYIAENKEHIIYGGNINEDLIYPTVLLRDVQKNEIKSQELFTPIFNIYEYEDLDEVINWLSKHNNVEKAMGMTYFGEHLDERIKNLSINYMFSFNKTLIECENPNAPFGGYGIQSGYVCIDGKTYSKPILLSQEIGLNLKNKQTAPV